MPCLANGKESSDCEKKEVADLLEVNRFGHHAVAKDATSSWPDF